MSRRIYAHPAHQANTVREALKALKRHVASGGVVDQAWIDEGGPVRESTPTGDGCFYVIEALEVTSLPYSDKVEVILHPQD